MSQNSRYAIYYTPAHRSDLDRFGAHLLGYDAFNDEDLPFAGGIETEIPDWHGLTQDPRKYGFHATLKAPMVLADGKTEAELVAAVDNFAQLPRHIPVITPVVRAIGDFLAIVPAAPVPALETLAADCVTAFDDFRAPLTAHDRARRHPDRLAPRQRDYLDRWGYPYVMEEFRFHMTLTGRLPAERREIILETLQRRFSVLDLATLAIDRIALFRQDDAASRFRIVHEIALTKTGE